MDEITEQAVKALLEDGAEMRNALRVLNRHLLKVRAGLADGGAHGWRLFTNMPHNDATQVAATFSQALDAALLLLEQRSGADKSIVTKSEDVPKSWGADERTP